MKKSYQVFLILISVIALSSCISSDFLPPQSGQYEIIGTTLFVCDDPRGIVVQAWYPASGIGEGILDPVIDYEVAKALTGGFMPITEKHLKKALPSSSYLDAPIRQADEAYPIIIFEHGFEGYSKQNMTQMEELASNGYVVFALSHPGETVLTLYPDGKMVGKDNERYPSLVADTKKERKANATQTEGIARKVRSAGSSAHRIQYMEEMSAIPRIHSLILPITERTVDVLNFMEILNTMSQDGFFAGMIDTDRVGLYGHSMGGATANKVAGMDSWPVNLRAVANLDGPQFFSSKDEEALGPQIPYFQAYSTSTYIDGITVNMEGFNDWAIDECPDETLRIVFRGSTHTNFTDLTYIKIMEGSSTGKIDGYAMGHAQEQALLVWFDRHLKGLDIDTTELRESYDLWEIKYNKPDM